MKRIISGIITIVLLCNMIPLAVNAENSHTYIQPFILVAQNKNEEQFRKWACNLFAEYIINLKTENLVNDLNKGIKVNEHVFQQGIFDVYKNVEYNTGAKLIRHWDPATSVMDLCDYHPYYLVANQKMKFDETAETIFSNGASGANIFNKQLRLVKYSSLSMKATESERNMVYLWTIMETIKEKHTANGNVWALTTGRPVEYLFNIATGKMEKAYLMQDIQDSSDKEATVDVWNAFWDTATYAISGLTEGGKLVENVKDEAVEKLKKLGNDLGIEITGVTENTNLKDKLKSLWKSVGYSCIEIATKKFIDYQQEKLELIYDNYQNQLANLIARDVTNQLRDQIQYVQHESSEIIRKEIEAYQNSNVGKTNAQGSHDYEKALREIMEIINSSDLEEGIMTSDATTELIKNKIGLKDVISEYQIQRMLHYMAVADMSDVAVDLIAEIICGALDTAKKIIADKLPTAGNNFMTEFDSWIEECCTYAKEMVKEAIKETYEDIEEIDKESTEHTVNDKYAAFFNEILLVKLEQKFYPASNPPGTIYHNFTEYVIYRGIMHIIKFLEKNVTLKEDYRKAVNKKLAERYGKKKEQSEEEIINEIISELLTAVIDSVWEVFKAYYSDENGKWLNDEIALKNMETSYKDWKKDLTSELIEKDESVDTIAMILEAYIFLSTVMTYMNKHVSDNANVQLVTELNIHTQDYETIELLSANKAIGRNQQADIVQAIGKGVQKFADTFSKDIVKSTKFWTAVSKKIGTPTGTKKYGNDSQIEVPSGIKAKIEGIVVTFADFLSIFGDFIANMWEAAQDPGVSIWKAYYSSWESSSNEELLSFEAQICYQAWSRSRAIEDYIIKHLEDPKTLARKEKMSYSSTVPEDYYMFLKPTDILDPIITPDLNEIYQLTMMILMQNEYDAVGMGYYFSISEKLSSRWNPRGGPADWGKQYDSSIDPGGYFYAETSFGIAYLSNIILQPSTAVEKYNNVVKFGKKYRNDWEKSWDELLTE